MSLDDQDVPEHANGVENAAVFHPIDRTRSPSSIPSTEEQWTTMLETTCTFPPDIFEGVMLNLIKNPNITSSHLFRADIFYDSGDVSHLVLGDDASSITPFRHLKSEYRPRTATLPGYDLKRTIVRQLVPRNPQLDKPLVQTCHIFTRLQEEREDNLVLYIPHVQHAGEVPFYHPAVAKLAFLHTWKASDVQSLENQSPSGSISISYCLFPDTTMTTKLERTALKLLQTVHKHGQGQLAGYQKRVHLDQIIPQKRYQDTYARLKAKYGKQLAEQWVEVTDPGKHVFEDIAIAAYLIELWKGVYSEVGRDEEDRQSKQAFPGFVDIGCGNGVLVYILSEEGYDGFGFDARRRKTWSIFPQHVQDRLQQRILVPKILQSGLGQVDTGEWHDGVFDTGTFIVSNHADELTAWTPLLAYLNGSDFIAIPCCSHDLAGSRFRAPPSTKSTRSTPARLPQRAEPSENGANDRNGPSANGQAAETGSLKRTEAQKKMPSAYATLCSYVASMADEVGFTTEADVLRIPSTRNHCIVGRCPDRARLSSQDERQGTVKEILEREVGKPIDVIGAEWVERAMKLAKKPGSGH